VESTSEAVKIVESSEAVSEVQRLLAHVDEDEASRKETLQMIYECAGSVCEGSTLSGIELPSL
jgi:hypothetical protein